ncbi:ead/Ea22-like family protein [Erwinia aphidicola]|uniref:ead/Ea22-like family protein n=1 Tax=Erwinia aphidicola TaxID=68334 RepID=UPI0020A22C03|nr:ead/Ea22-like family protein [Erwinia aphidicola]MCP2232845.1 hypothetical protein [Erwinia aphidicola]
MNTQKLKELARRATGGIWKAFINEKTNKFAIHTPDDARCGNIVDWMGFDGVNCSKKQKAHNARFIAASNPAVVIQLIEALQAAERERDELREEIARRDAAAGEPVYQVGTDGQWYDCKEYIYQDAKERRDACRILYTAAQPAVLSEIVVVAKAMRDWIDAVTKDVAASLPTMPGFDRDWADETIIAATRSAQPQKVVVLPDYDEPTKVGVTWYDGYNHGVSDCVKALDADGVKWEVKK